MTPVSDPSQNPHSHADKQCTVSLEGAADRIREISSIPSVALRVMQVVSDTESGASDLRAAVEADPALATRVLRVVNSSAFALRETVADLTQAIALLGFNRVRDLAVTASISDLFRNDEPIGPYRRTELWRHLVVTGLATRVIASRTRIPDASSAFLAGLLHDLGIILADQCVHEDYRKVLAGLGPNSNLAERERKILGWDHTQLGEKLAERWKLPASIRAAIRFHHTPNESPQEHQGIVHAVAVANFVTSMRHVPSVGVHLVALDSTSLPALSLSPAQFDALHERFEHELEQNKQLFEIQGK